ncbi:hypothetical protein VPH35_004640 [Triticum aestivum]|uniref:Uncharacterized protein n=1 Tax=Triticum urartu TaxID=4572 RepID=A0A8R7K3A8_TRIUA
MVARRGLHATSHGGLITPPARPSPVLDSLSAAACSSSLAMNSAASFLVISTFNRTPPSSTRHSGHATSFSSTTSLAAAGRSLLFTILAAPARVASITLVSLHMRGSGRALPMFAQPRSTSME